MTDGCEKVPHAQQRLLPQTGGRSKSHMRVCSTREAVDLLENKYLFRMPDNHYVQLYMYIIYFPLHKWSANLKPPSHLWHTKEAPRALFYFCKVGGSDCFYVHVFLTTLKTTQLCFNRKVCVVTIRDNDWMLLHREHNAFHNRGFTGRLLRLNTTWLNQRSGRPRVPSVSGFRLAGFTSTAPLGVRYEAPASPVDCTLTDHFL